MNSSSTLCLDLQDSVRRFFLEPYVCIFCPFFVPVPIKTQKTFYEVVRASSELQTAV